MRIVQEPKRTLVLALESGLSNFSGSRWRARYSTPGAGGPAEQRLVNQPEPIRNLVGIIVLVKRDTE
jgi:hypothetical protein